MAKPAGARTNESTEAQREQDQQRNDSGEPQEGETDRIARRAYERFEARGGEHGHDQEDWFAAEQEIRSGGGRADRDVRGADQISGDVDARRLEEAASGIGKGPRELAGGRRNP